ncbi:Chromo (CHRromatin Organization MOdifier) domain [Carpediemonas membranifera]|uniref:Chromo (CHRromatin Organization MOdifier) domain n=1 Tax=Carpediemonas membranifera TaxID=201153 RepID=A0A8J6B9T3_9EUKA|nr:Chromo (CHRromatin Organization MOdifier) domain [Carpediemonas membranifera]|eukprot:KAG9392937.1 Chromo (CHRromatin Organization MOdifier) domain [Carpediemonas membranifera]
MDGYGEWSQLLPFVQHILNTSTHTKLGVSPHEVVYGRRAEIGLVRNQQAALERPDIAQYLDRLAHVQDNLDKVITQCNKREERLGPAPTRPAIRSGDLVFIKPAVKHKLHGLLGPFKVHAIHSNNAVEVASLLNDERQFTHLDKIALCPDISLELARQYAASDDERYIVEQVLEHNTRDHTLLIKWEGYTQTTWEPLTRDNAKVGPISDYLRQHRIRWKPLNTSERGRSRMS